MNSEPTQIVCIQCNQEVLDPPVLNQDAQGRNCRVCADRVLEAQPGLLPVDPDSLRGPKPAPRLVLVRDEAADADGDDWAPEPA